MKRYMEDGSGAKSILRVKKESACEIMNKGGTTGNSRPFVHDFFI